MIVQSTIKTGEGYVSASKPFTDVFAETYPSSGASRHLLPQGACCANERLRQEQIGRESPVTTIAGFDVVAYGLVIAGWWFTLRLRPTCAC